MTARRGAQGAGAEPPPATDAFTAALLRAGQSIAGLDLAVADADIRPAAAADVVALGDDHALVLALARGDDPAAGALVLSAPALAALVEAVTTGAPGRHALDPRRPTRTDAALVAGFVDALLAALPAAVPWRLSHPLAGARALALMLPDAGLTLSQAGLRFAAGQRDGAIWLALPPDPPESGGPAAEEGEAAFDLAPRLDAAEVRMDAVLARLQMPLSQLMALSEGEVLPLQGASLDGVRLTAVDGRLVGEGRLGQIRGQRALRLTQTPAVPQPALSRAAG
jgi:flagellar motor switch protein FliM